MGPNRDQWEGASQGGIGPLKLKFVRFHEVTNQDVCEFQMDVDLFRCSNAAGRPAPGKDNFYCNNADKPWAWKISRLVKSKFDQDRWKAYVNTSTYQLCKEKGKVGPRGVCLSGRGDGVCQV